MKRVSFLICLISLLTFLPSTQAGATTQLTYSYDQNGNLIQGDGKYFEYNDANQLVRVRHGNASGPVIAQYFYDYQGQRIKKIENGVVTYYIGKHYLTQVDGSTVTNTSYYFANGERVAKKDSSGKLSYYLNDHLGGTNDIVDSSGNLVERTSYYPFGDIRQGGSDTYTYTGKEKDKFTDSFYFEARYYNPALKHFSKADTVDSNFYAPQDANRYAYSRNNPISLIDPSGHAAIGSRAWLRELNSAELHNKHKYHEMLRSLAKRQSHIASNLTKRLSNIIEASQYRLKNGQIATNPKAIYRSLLDPQEGNSSSSRLTPAERAYLKQIMQEDLADAAYWNAYAQGLTQAMKNVESYTAGAILGLITGGASLVETVGSGGVAIWNAESGSYESQVASDIDTIVGESKAIGVSATYVGEALSILADF